MFHSLALLFWKSPGERRFRVSVCLLCCEQAAASLLSYNTTLCLWCYHYLQNEAVMSAARSAHPLGSTEVVYGFNDDEKEEI